MARRLLAIAAALDGMSREAAARIAGMDRQTLRDWVIRYNRGGPAGLSDHWGDGRPCRLTEGQQATLKAIVLQGPDPEVDGVSTWRLVDLCRIVQERFGVIYGGTVMGRLMQAIVEACCTAWNSLIAETGRIRSLTDFDWARPVNP